MQKIAPNSTFFTSNQRHSDFPKQIKTPFSLSNHNINTILCYLPYLLQNGFIWLMNAFFVQSRGSAKSKKNEKTQFFLGKNRAIFKKKIQNFGNQYKPPKYTSSPKFGWFEAFLAKKLQILSIFGPNFGGRPLYLVSRYRT